MGRALWQSAQDCLHTRSSAHTPRATSKVTIRHVNKKHRSGWKDGCATARSWLGRAVKHTGKTRADSNRARLRRKGSGRRKVLVSQAWDVGPAAGDAESNPSRRTHLSCSCVSVNTCTVKLALVAKSSHVRSETMSCYLFWHAPVKAAHTVSS